MTATLEAIPVAKNQKKKTEDTSAGKGRVEFQAPDTWILRAEKVAARIGLSLSAYIRMVVTEDMDRRELRTE